MVNVVAFSFGLLLFVQNMYTLLISRCVQGLCLGVYATLANLIVKELSPVEISGTLGTLPEIGVSTGVNLTLLATYILTRATGDLTCESFWHFIFAIPLLTPVT